MLSYAFQTLNQETYDDVAVESFDEMYNLLAAILAKGIGLQLKQGLYREYISRQEELPVMRGKINMPGTIKNKLAHERVLTCDFDELSENNTLNQILKTTVTLLLRNGKVQAKYKDDLKKKCQWRDCAASIFWKNRPEVRSYLKAWISQRKSIKIHREKL